MAAEAARAAVTGSQESFVFTLAPDREGIRFSAEEKAAFRCRMRVLRGGEPAMNDSRRFRMPLEDCAVIVGNAKKRMADGTIPHLYEHGWGPMGEEAGGKALDVLEENGDIWIVAQLTAEMWEASVEPGLKWHGRSAGFSGYWDGDDFIRCADIFEWSATNFPAMRGLGAVEQMSAARERASSRSTVRLASGLVVPASSVDQSSNGVSLTGRDAESATASPAAASKPKESEMKFSKEFLVSLGLADGASPEDVEKATAAKLAAAAATQTPATPTPKPAATEQLTAGAAATPATAPVDVRAEVREMLRQEREAARTEVRAEMAAERKAQRVTELLAKATSLGKVLSSKEEQDAWRLRIERDPEDFAASVLPILPVRAPVRGAVPSPQSDLSSSAAAPTEFAAGTPGRDAYLTKVARFARRNSISQSQANDYLTQHPEALEQVN